MTEPRRAVILMAETGGGHRSAALALQQALIGGEPAWDCQVIEALEAYGGPMARMVAGWYSPIIRRSPRFWGSLYRLSDSPRRFAMTTAWGEPAFRRRLGRALAEAAPDLVISVHPLFNRSLGDLRRSGRLSCPWAVVVTDLVTVHAGWLAGGAERYCVATEEAARQCVARGLDESQVAVTGLPVDLTLDQPRLTEPQRRLARRGWGFAPSPFTVLLAGGAEGAGGIWNTLGALDLEASRGAAGRRTSAGALQVVAVCGRNDDLRRRIEARRWHLPVHALGFTDRMAELLRLSDLLVTKAGPASVSEGLAAGVPLLMTAALPGQETANVELIERLGAGAWVPGASELAALVARLAVAGSARYQSWRVAARRAGRPGAARSAVEALAPLAVRV